MNVSERLTKAARMGAQGHTATGFNLLPEAQQTKVMNWVMGQPDLVSEIVRASLLAMPAADLGELLSDGDFGAEPRTKSEHLG